MICRSCGFANMKNMTVCARCGAKLAWDGKIRKEDFRPRRLSLWERLHHRQRRRFPSLSRLYRLCGGFFSLCTRIPRKNRAWALASILPGMGQILRLDLRKGIALLLGWTALGALAWSFHAENLVYRAGRLLNQGALLAVVAPTAMALLHGYALFDALRPGDFCRTNGEARAMAALTALTVFLLYGIFTLLLW